MKKRRSVALEKLEIEACTPRSLKTSGFNPKSVIPYGCTTTAIQKGMQDFLDFLGFINLQLQSKKIDRLESFVMMANFSSIVGEFMGASIPKYCKTVLRNEYHNGHPDLIPVNRYPGNSVLHGEEGIEIKGSRHMNGWQGHNPENCWLLVFIFESNTPRDNVLGKPPIPFRFRQVLGAKLSTSDWNFSGRSATSRRTITASVNKSGYKKIRKNWIYED